MRLFSIFAALAFTTTLAACVPANTADVTKGAFDAPLANPGVVAMHAFPSGPAIGVMRSNVELANDFLDLQFRMESGRALPVLTRFEGPITVAMTGDVPPSARSELARLISRFRAEAGLNISQTSGPASITIDFQPKSALRRAVPTAACFVVPNVTGLADYVKKRNTAAVDWARMNRRDKVAIMAPSDASPQEVRDCLHEELAQAMGPLNDLFRLPDSVFNDDNFHSVLTGFDMLMLRAHYAPELRSGMNEAEVAARLPALLARLNPRGQGIGGTPKQISPRSWISATEAAFGARGGNRIDAAERMISIAKAQGWTDTRMAFSLFARGRALTARDVPAAIEAYSQAARIWRNIPGAQIHAAHVDMQLGAFALTSGQFESVLLLTDRSIPVARSHQNASLLASLLAMRAEALEATGRGAEARSVRLDSQGWARYAFGSDAQVRARLSDIATLARRGGRG
ncbi:MAG: DUF2927 domain-containing protein [Pseudotabrizicola sp.]|uniref:DUF2927 domain-containing protein n=1 Tax=Pseudotabrizicola sp. TaxID=2939647 RepID=UPI00271604D9|nr:DUF2927 domain-containing protein [Pseudotabrizicola sp.]MDO8882949.1 DUF2927 domain-containing protein [Pseudotabrizicola sp.]MDP2079754.1 DUF2927 domain-containing protein [Pseudotabrizicola sp.]MDZ7574755.1 DUF2927 domain-containing protein [Pseudotabrizicola sp.]